MLANWYQNNHRIVCLPVFTWKLTGNIWVKKAPHTAVPGKKIFDDAPKTDYDFALGDGITITYLVTPQGMIGMGPK